MTAPVQERLKGEVLAGPCSLELAQHSVEVFEKRGIHVAIEPLGNAYVVREVL